MTSHLHPTLSELNCHQLHLHVSDGGFSLPDILLVRESAFPASFAQCIHDVTDILTTNYRWHSLRFPRSWRLSYVTLIQFLMLSSTQSRSLPYMTQFCRYSLCCLHSVQIPSSNTPYITAAINTPSLPFSTPCNNSMTPPGLPTTIPRLMTTLAHGPALIPVLVITPW